MIEIRAFIPKERYKYVELPVIKGLTFVLYDDTFNIPENFTNTVFISANGLKEDEAQEYTADQETALKYIVTDSKNPQTIMCGTPPTAVSAGTVFVKLRQLILSGESEDAGWAEWSVISTIVTGKQIGRAHV